MIQKRYIPVMLLTVLVVGDSWSASALRRGAQQVGTKLVTKAPRSGITGPATSRFYTGFTNQGRGVNSLAMETTGTRLFPKSTNRALETFQQQSRNYSNSGNYWNQFKGMASNGWTRIFSVFGLGGAAAYFGIGKVSGEEESRIKQEIEKLQHELELTGGDRAFFNWERISSIEREANEKFREAAKREGIRGDEKGYSAKVINQFGELVEMMTDIFKLKALASAASLSDDKYTEFQKADRLQQWRTMHGNVPYRIRGAMRDYTDDLNLAALKVRFKGVPDPIVPKFFRDQIYYIAMDPVLREEFKKDLDGEIDAVELEIKVSRSEDAIEAQRGRLRVSAIAAIFQEAVDWARDVNSDSEEYSKLIELFGPLSTFSNNAYN